MHTHYDKKIILIICIAIMKCHDKFKLDFAYTTY